MIQKLLKAILGPCTTRRNKLTLSKLFLACSGVGVCKSATGKMHASSHVTFFTSRTSAQNERFSFKNISLSSIDLAFSNNIYVRCAGHSEMVEVLKQENRFPKASEFFWN